MNLTTKTLSINPADNFRLNAGVLREGIPVQKGVTISEEFLEENEELIK